MTIDLAFLVLAVTAVASSGVFYFGYWTGKNQPQVKSLQQIEQYIADSFPTEWAAYKKGVTEGYEAGLFDGQRLLEGQGPIQT